MVNEFGSDVIDNLFITDPTLTVPTSVLPRRPKPSSVTTSPHIREWKCTAPGFDRFSLQLTSIIG